VQTLIIIVVAGLFVGMVMALQSYYALVDFRCDSFDIFTRSRYPLCSFRTGFSNHRKTLERQIGLP